jgi:hypothetical protein
MWVTMAKTYQFLAIRLHPGGLTQPPLIHACKYCTRDRDRYDPQKLNINATELLRAVSSYPSK